VINNDLKIDHSEHFGTLAEAPIVEAVIHWQAAATTKFFEVDFKDKLDSAFPDYQTQNQHNLTTRFRGTDQDISVSHQNTLRGARLSKNNGDENFACQVVKDGVVFSQLAPYSDWTALATEANRFWTYYKQEAQPHEISRLASRYISQVPVKNATEATKYIETVCQPLSGIDLLADEYFHQDTINLTNHSYSISLIRAVQTSSNQQKQLLIDITVYTQSAIHADEDLEKILKDIRYIKNKVFFTLMSDPSANFGGTPRA